MSFLESFGGLALALLRFGGWFELCWLGQGNRYGR